jgi:phosphoadenosine phosphosulfate reductase
LTRPLNIDNGYGMIRNNLFENVNLIDTAIQRLQKHEPENGYYLAFSGGKDSIVIKALADMSGVKYDAHYNSTTIDPPELVKFIKQYHADVAIDRPPRPFLQEMVKRGFPQRQRRWCCEYLKEHGGEGRTVITGIRWEESRNRAKRKIFEVDTRKGDKHYLNPIADWKEVDVWEFIDKNNIPYCSLYDDGAGRIGCLFCPMAGKRRLIELERYPKYAKAFIRAFEKLYEKRKSEGNTSVDRWANGEDMFMWWISENRTCDNPDQGDLFL